MAIRVMLVVCIALSVGQSSMSSALAQQVTLHSPLQNVGDRFFESNHIGWQVRGKNFFATFGNSNRGFPPFGGFDPNAGLSGGFAIRGRRLSSSFNFNFSQGSSRTHTSTAPVFTTMNGIPGRISSTVTRPFVISQIPVVGNQPRVVPITDNRSVLRDRLLRGRSAPVTQRTRAQSGLSMRGSSSNTRSSLTSAEHAFQQLHASNTRPRSRSIDSTPLRMPGSAAAASAGGSKLGSERLNSTSYFQRGQQAEKRGKLGVAKLYYRMAAKRSGGALKQKAMERLAAIK